MTTRTDEVTTRRERINALVAHKREEGSEVKLFSEPEPEPAKPLVEFDAPPVAVATPLTW